MTLKHQQKASTSFIASPSEGNRQQRRRLRYHPKVWQLNKDLHPGANDLVLPLAKIEP